MLRQPLFPEELQLTERSAEWVITGPTFTYHVEKRTGVIGGVRVQREGRDVFRSIGPAAILLDGRQIPSKADSCQPTIRQQGRDRIVLEIRGSARDPDVHYALTHTFFNDGVVVSDVTLLPRADLQVRQAIAFQFPAQGEFTHYLHKRRNEHGADAARGNLPDVGGVVRFGGLSSCLSVFSPSAALAIFTDSGATHLSRTNLDTALVEVGARAKGGARLSLAQFIARVAPGDSPLVLKAGEPFRFRVGLSVAPSRLMHPRSRDLRMFTWIGDARFPYPTDEEIAQVARWGFTVFQMHRIGTPGEPRPPAGELERVIRKVHETGMLFLWEENADLMFAHAPEVQRLRAQGRWTLWQGFNYAGRYTASMDPFCDLVATCLASPNGLADYRLANLERMLDRFAVDGVYLDNNLAYGNCRLWKEHGHPHPVYDCLIELHEMNWRRRELLRRRCPHALLVSHCTTAFVLPVIADFDALLFAEGYSFRSAEEYWVLYKAWSLNLPSQSMIWPGGQDPVRCPAALAYNLDWLTGGGQYTQIDWRLFANKFPHAAGVSEAEPLYVETYNPAQAFFGMYESRPFYFANSTNLFAATTAGTYATVYRNEVWRDWLLAVANMDTQPHCTSVRFRTPRALGFKSGAHYALFDVHHRSVKGFSGSALTEVFRNLMVDGQGLRLFYVRERRADAPFHLWGGKRIAERWDAHSLTFTVELHGPPGLRHEIFIADPARRIRSVHVAGQPSEFFRDPAQGLVHGEVTFRRDPLRIEAFCAPNHLPGLPEKAVCAATLVTHAR